MSLIEFEKNSQIKRLVRNIFFTFDGLIAIIVHVAISYQVSLTAEFDRLFTACLNSYTITFSELKA